MTDARASSCQTCHELLVDEGHDRGHRCPPKFTITEPGGSERERVAYAHDAEAAALKVAEELDLEGFNLLGDPEGAVLLVASEAGELKQFRVKSEVRYTAELI